jgi:type IV secretion system protein VirB9
MRKALLVVAAAALAVAPAWAQVRPTPGPGDPHIQFVEYSPDHVIVLEGAPGYQVTLELSPDEQVQSVAVGDSGAWQVTANRNGDHLFVKAIMAGVSTNMTVVSDVRLYNFELRPMASTGRIPYTVRFRYPAIERAAVDYAPSAMGEGLYRLRGKQKLRPSEISDDGTRTYIRWPRDRSLPAVYAVSDTGQEMLVNGLMREDDVFVIDSVAPKLVFRIDRQVATATRLRTRN